MPDKEKDINLEVNAGEDEIKVDADNEVKEEENFEVEAENTDESSKKETGGKHVLCDLPGLRPEDPRIRGRPRGSGRKKARHAFPWQRAHGPEADRSMRQRRDRAVRGDVAGRSGPGHPRDPAEAVRKRRPAA